MWSGDGDKLLDVLIGGVAVNEFEDDLAGRTEAIITSAGTTTLLVQLMMFGETMKRVRLIAGRIGAETFELEPWPGMWPAIWKNFKWLIGHIFAKDEIVDAGIDLDRTTGRSPFYKMEHIVTNLFEAR